MGRRATPSLAELEGFRLGDVVLCGYDRHPLRWRILLLRNSVVAGRLVGLADLGCVDVAGSTKRNHRVGMCREKVALAHLKLAERG